MILSPFLNKLIFSLDYQQYRRFLSVLIVIFVVLMGGIPRVFREMTEGRLMPVLIMYFIAGYIRRFVSIKNRNSSRHFINAIVFYLLLFVTFYGITYLGIIFNSQTILDNRYFYRKLNSPFIVVICIELFIGFLKLDCKYNKLINEIASCTFGVFLLHSNRIINRRCLPKLFPIYKETYPILIFLYSVISVLLIYAIGTLIDYIRKKSVERMWMTFLNLYLELIQNKIKIVGKSLFNCFEKWFGRFSL